MRADRSGSPGEICGVPHWVSHSTHLQRSEAKSYSLWDRITSFENRLLATGGARARGSVLEEKAMKHVRCGKISLIKHAGNVQFSSASKTSTLPEETFMLINYERW